MGWENDGSSESEELNAHQLRQQQARDDFKNYALKELVGEMVAVRVYKDETEDTLKVINARYDVLRIELIPAAMEKAGIEKINYEGIGRVSLTGDMNVSIKNKLGYFMWLRNQKLGDLIQETVNSSTLKSWVKGRIKDGKPIPEDLLKVTPFTRTTITKG